MLPVKLTLLSLIYLNHSTVQQLLLHLSDVYTFTNCSPRYHQSFWFSLSLTSSTHSNSNVGGELWVWFLAYLPNRFQLVSTNSYNSYHLPALLFTWMTSLVQLLTVKCYCLRMTQNALKTLEYVVICTFHNMI